MKARSLVIIQQMASWLARSSVTPNQISVLSVVFSLLVPFSFATLEAGSWAASFVALLGIQLRLLCNLLDGMVAIEGQKKSVLGDIYNEFPDRIADTIILVGIALCDRLDSVLLVFAVTAALMAAMTAYTRVLGASVGTKQCFSGPMAKQHRMALLTATIMAMPILPSSLSYQTTLKFALVVISLGCIATIAIRLRKISMELQSKAGNFER
jgi:phosphatidylglycerophosphate synthase